MPWKFNGEEIPALPPTVRVGDYNVPAASLNGPALEAMGYVWEDQAPYEPTPEELAALVRAERNARLAACDWTQMPDAPLTEAQRAAWAEYRLGLRDVPQQPGFPAAVQWPGAPQG